MSETSHFVRMRELILRNVHSEAAIHEMLELLGRIQLESVDRLLTSAQMLEQAAVLRHPELDVRQPAEAAKPGRESTLFATQAEPPRPKRERRNANVNPNPPPPAAPPTTRMKP